MKKLFLWAILSAAVLWPQQVTYKFKGKYFDITLTRVGFPTLPLDNGVRKVPPPKDGTQHTAGYVPGLPPLAPSPEGYILRAHARGAARFDTLPLRVLRGRRINTRSERGRRFMFTRVRDTTISRTPPRAVYGRG